MGFLIRIPHQPFGDIIMHKKFDDTRLYHNDALSIFFDNIPGGIVKKLEVQNKRFYVIGDFIIPNEMKNPYAQKRYNKIVVKEDNFFKLMDGYIVAMANDIFLSATIEKLKSVAMVMKSRGMHRNSEFIEKYIRENLTKKPPAVDNWLGLRQGTLPRRMAGRIIKARQLSALVGNLPWMVFTQPMSTANTIMKTGLRNTIKGMLKWISSPKTREQIHQFNVMRLKKKAGVISTAGGDLDVSAQKAYSGKIDKWNDFLSYLGNVCEYHLTGAATSAGLLQGKQYKLKGKDLEMYADYIGQVTQSLYNPEARMLLLNSMAVRANAPFQSFPGEMFRHARTIAGKGGGLPLTKKQRFQHVANMLVAMTIGSFLATRGFKKLTVGAWLPLVGGIIDEQLDKLVGTYLASEGKHKIRTQGRSPIAPGEDARRMTRAITDAIEYGNLTRLRQELVFWGMGIAGIGGGVQVNRFVDGIIAAEKGFVDDVRGRKLFDLQPWDKLFAPIVGPWKTESGVEYFKPKEEKKSILSKLTPQQQKKFQITERAKRRLTRIKTLIKYANEKGDKNRVTKLKEEYKNIVDETRRQIIQIK